MTAREDPSMRAGESRPRYPVYRFAGNPVSGMIENMKILATGGTGAPAGQPALPFKFRRQLGERRLLCPDHREGTTTFEQYLERRYAPLR